jgi:RNA polymerase sigma factor (sigma-70 family)
MPNGRHSSAHDSSDPFGSTRWSIVLAAAGEGALAQAALESLCQTYWLPIYGYIRSRSGCPEEANDLTQGFFVDLIERESLATADRNRGRFRSFLFTAVKNFLINCNAHEAAQKRGGGRTILSLDWDVAESRLSTSRSSTRTPEQEFERQWALAVLDHVITRIAEEQKAAGREREFAALRPFLTGQQADVSQILVAQSLQITPEAVRAAVYRLRKRYRELLRDEVAQTVESTEEVDEELQRLIAAVSF